MGVLKTLTDEYFGENVRAEDGKTIKINGFKAIVPENYTEKEFFVLIDTILVEGEGEFVNEKYLDSGYYNIKCGNNYYLSLNPKDVINKMLKENGFDLNNTQFNSALKFIEYLVEDVCFIYTKNRDYILLADISILYNKFYCDDLDDWESQQCYDNLIDWFLEDFNKAEIVVGEIEGYYDNELILRVCNGNSKIMFKTLLYAKEMVEWWKNHLSDIEKNGAREYFGLTDEEEE